jgi:ParB/RepB/Spo0J family partition protein
MPENQPFEYIPLDQIDPNPYSCRLSEDAEHVKKVALSIATEGLMQFPIGRRVDGRVQLAFGHTRLAAFRLLTHTNNPGFGLMPVILRDLDEEEMFRFGVSENLARKDLTPIEEAKAMKRYRDDFHKTSVEIGALFNLSESAVRNKIRLLDLPEDIQAGFIWGRISEGAGREILTLFDLPEELREKSNLHWNGANDIVKTALNGATAERIHISIDELIRAFGALLDNKKFKSDEIFPASPLLIGLCNQCPFKITRNKETWCVKPSCFSYKKSSWELDYLAKASAAVCWIPVMEGSDGGYCRDFGSTSDHEILLSALSIHCPNLRLVFDPDSYRYQNNNLKEHGFPMAKIICQKQTQFCGCSTAIKAGLKEELLGKVASPENVAPGNGLITSKEYGVIVSGDENASDAITVEQLKDIVRAARQQKKQAMVEIEGMNLDAAKQIAAGLLDVNTNPKLLLTLLDTAGGATYEINKESGGNFSENPLAWCDEIRYEIGKILISKNVSENYYYSEPDPEKSLKRLNEFLKNAGLQELESVSAETIREQDRKTTKEIYGREI